MSASNRSLQAIDLSNTHQTNSVMNSYPYPSIGTICMRQYTLNFLSRVLS